MQTTPVQYKVQLNPLALEVEVTIHIADEVISSVNGSLKLDIPTWVPGDYAFETYGRDIFSVSVKDANDQELKVIRAGNDGYTVGVSKGPVTVSYKASCYEPDLGDAMGLVDSDYAVLMGTRYLYCPDYLESCSVAYEFPDSWKIHHPSGAQRVEDRNTWIYPTFEVLLDTPVYFGTFDVIQKMVKEVPFYFVFVDKGLAFDQKVEEFVNQVCLAAEKIEDVFGLFPFTDYTFVLSLNPQADWGLEHLTSNMSGLGPEVFVDDNLYSTGIRVCAHELFHAWNVRRLRPSPLGQLRHHLETGSFTEGLWMAEGFTRYYEFLISIRAGAYTADQFFSAVVGYYSHLTQQPAYHRVSATDSSLTSYLNHSKYPGRVNNSIDYYDKGMLIAFGLDARLRKAQDAKYSSLDDAFRAFYLAYFGDGHTVPPSYEGYSTQDVINFYEGVQTGLGKVVANQVNEPSNLDTVTQLENLGFEVHWENDHCVGIFFMNDGAPTIYGVADDSAAGAVGVAPGDVIISLNGFAYSEKGLEWLANQSEPFEMEVLRGHRKLSFKLQPRLIYRIKFLTWIGNPEQSKVIKDWLEVSEFSPDPGQKFTTDFYDNFHGVESMV